MRFSYGLFGLVFFAKLANAQVQDKQQSWADSSRQSVQNVLRYTAEEMNSWFGTPKAEQPAKARLRMVIDSRWDKHEGYSIKPRLRGKVELPTLKERLNVVFGDDSIDDELSGQENIAANTAKYVPQHKKVDFRQARRENSSIGLQWEVPRKDNDVKTKFSLGLRSKGDIYAKMKIEKDWYYGSSFRTRNAFIYRYGVKSRHQVRMNVGLDYASAEHVVNSSQFHLEYHNDETDGWTWGNTLSRKHFLSEEEWFQYGIYTGGAISKGEVSLDTYGPFVGVRSNIYRDWLFIQPELTFYNNKAEDKKHHVGVMLRLEILF